MSATRHMPADERAAAVLARWSPDGLGGWTPVLHREIAAAIREAEAVMRERCARVCEQGAALWPDQPLLMRNLVAAADDIRALPIAE